MWCFWKNLMLAALNEKALSRILYPMQHPVDKYSVFLGKCPSVMKFCDYLYGSSLLLLICQMHIQRNVFLKTKEVKSCWRWLLTAPLLFLNFFLLLSKARTLLLFHSIFSQISEIRIKLCDVNKQFILQSIRGLLLFPGI